LAETSTDPLLVIRGAGRVKRAQREVCGQAPAEQVREEASPDLTDQSRSDRGDERTLKKMSVANVASRPRTAYAFGTWLCFSRLTRAGYLLSLATCQRVRAEPPTHSLSSEFT